EIAVGNLLSAYHGENVCDDFGEGAAFERRERPYGASDTSGRGGAGDGRGQDNLDAVVSRPHYEDLEPIW
ncbi:hypothetical protein, partial [Streptococcus pneumoniae]|uniref:hypothetical protein n=1 Tax=Streptococcus pneumoniae TaxID=1313 RepID=UPI001953AB46